MKLKLCTLLGLISFGYSLAQKEPINKELNFCLKFLVGSDTIPANKEYTIFINGDFPEDKSGHQGGIIQNIKRTDQKGKFKVYISNPGEYEFIIPEKGLVKQQVDSITDYILLVNSKSK